MSAPGAVPAVHTDQGPPLSIPLSFFFTGPLALGAAGVVLLLRADDGVATLWAPSTVAVLHLGAVGFLLLTMLGALYQLLPVVAGAVVPAVRLAHAVHALLVAGSAALVVGQWKGSPLAFQLALALLLAGALLFLGPAGVALSRSRVAGPTAWGLRLSLLSFAAVVGLGALLASLRLGLPFKVDGLTLRFAHAHVAFLCLVGGLATAVSWQVLPMFFLAPPPPRALAFAVMGGSGFSLVALCAVALHGAPPSAVAHAALPGAIAVWLVHPAWAFLALSRRRRRRKDATLHGWWLSMSAAPACFVLGACSVLFDDPRFPLAYGLVVVWGWGGALAHGMLGRIVPFLVWLHWCAPKVGLQPVPSAKELLTDREVSVGSGLQLLSLLTGLAAVATGELLIWRGFGLALVLVAGWLCWQLLTAVRRGRAPGKLAS